MKIKHYFLMITYAVVLYFLLINISYIWKIVLTIFSVLKPFVFGLAIAYIVNFPFSFCQNKLFVKLDTFKKGKLKFLKKPLSFVASYTFVFGIVIFLIAIIFPQIITSIKHLVSNFENYAVSVEEISLGFLKFIGATEQILKSATKYIVDFFLDIDKFLPQIIDFTKWFTVGIYNWIIGIIVSFYILGNKEVLKKQTKKIVYALSPEKYVSKIFKVCYLSSNIFGKYIVGTLLDSLIIGILCFVGMMIFSMPYALLISVIVGVTNIIPFFGPFIGAIPSFLILFIIDPIQALWFALFILVLQQADGNIIKPKILANSIGLSGLWVMFSVIIGGGLFGMVGMVMGVPLFAVIYLVISDIINKRLKSKNINHLDNVD